MLEPFWSLKDKPQFLSRTNTQYARAPLTQILHDRGLENRLLDSFVNGLPKGAYLAGGFITSVLQGDDKATDIDVFFNSPEAFEKTFNQLIDPEEYDLEEGWAWEGYELETQIKGSGKDLRFVKFVHEKRPPIQLIKLVWYDDAEHVIDSFDLTIAQFAVDGNELVFNPLGFLDIARKRIVLHRMQFPSSTLRRIIKYASKGYYACPGSLVNISEQITAIMTQFGAEDGQIVYVD